MNRARDERRLEAAAALLLEREVVPGPAPVPDFASLLGGRSRRWHWRTAGLALAVAAAGAITGVVAVPLIDPAPIAYVVAGAAAVSGGGVEAAASSAAPPARLNFSEGTEVTLAAGARLTVAERTPRGAVLELEHGQARFRVVHRRGARWSVVAGPFVVQVTGTEFTVDWSPGAGRMVVDLAVGAVRVGGASVGGTVELHAGERLVATAADHRLTLGPDDGSGPDSAGAGDFGAQANSSAPGLALPPARQPSRVVVDGSWPHAVDSRSRPARPVLALRSPGEGVPPAGAAGEGSSLPEPAVPLLDQPAVRSGEAGRGPRLEPAPVVAPRPSPIPQSLTMGGGGLFCVTVPAQYSFEDAANGLSAPRAYTLALVRPRIDRTHSWCGESSVRLDAAFDDGGRRNFFGRYANETGQLLVRLDRPTDLTGKTVTMHVFIEGPPDVRFSAEIAAVQHGGWASSPPVKDLAPGRWWTISHRFAVENPTGVAGSSNPLPYPSGGASTVAETDRLALAIHTTGDRRAWKGAVYVDDISW